MLIKSNYYPETSVIMTSYNYGAYISDAIESVINQSYKLWELIIIDDGSTDDSIDIINTFVKTYPDRIFLYSHNGNENKGITPTIELAISKVRGKFIAFLESDDMFEQNNLEKKVNILKTNSGVSLVFSDIELFGKDSKNPIYINNLKYLRYIGRTLKKEPKDVFNHIILRNPTLTFSNVAIRKSILNNFKLCIDNDIITDWQIDLLAAIMGKYFFIDEKLIKWRIHIESLHNSTYKHIDQHAAIALCRVCFSDIIKNVIDKNDAKKVVKYLYYPLTLKYKLWQLKHEISFLIYSFIR
jgi:glycosyltransferase involved in cell wall biosynthesis